MKDSDLDLHRRRLILEEEEHRLQQEKERVAVMEIRNKKLETNMTETEEELKALKKKYEKVHAEYVET